MLGLPGNPSKRQILALADMNNSSFVQAT